MKFIIMRTDQAGGYVARPGSRRSYIQALQWARTFDTREQAERERCPENEIVLRLEEAMVG